MSGAREFIHVICGSAGNYEERTEWRLEAYIKKSDADARVLAMKEIIRQLDEWLMTHGFNGSDITLESTDAECELYERWERKRNAAVEKFKKIAGDPNIDAYRAGSAGYWVEKLEIK